MTADPDDLAEAATVAAAAAHALSEQIEQVSIDRRADNALTRKQIILSALTVVVVILVVGGALGAGGALYVHDANKRAAAATADRDALAQTLARVEALAARIDDCISSDGKCYQERTNTRYGQPAGPANTVSVLAVVCGQTERGDAAIFECVRRKLAARP